jgi:hypothetical protein
MVQGSEWHAHHPRYRSVTHSRVRDDRVASGSTARPSLDPVTTQLARARQMAQGLQPFSPAWDAAMAWVDELETTLGRTSSG